MGPTGTRGWCGVHRESPAPGGGSEHVSAGWLWLEACSCGREKGSALVEIIFSCKKGFARSKKISLSSDSAVASS